MIVSFGLLASLSVVCSVYKVRYTSLFPTPVVDWLIFCIKVRASRDSCDYYYCTRKVLNISLYECISSFFI